MAFNHVDLDYSIVPVTVTQLVAWTIAKWVHRDFKSERTGMERDRNMKI